MFKPVSPKVNFPEQEDKTLSYWKENKIFEKSVESRPPDKKWTFLDGPPFVTGMPHYGHLLGSIHKDLFGRYWTMKGYRVRRVWGWDGHGLPVENKVEGKLGTTRKKDIEDKIGVKKFIEECKLYVSEVSSEWEWYVDHIARWVDFKNAYRTWDIPYMESVMWVFKQMYDKGHIYKGLKVTLYCPHCATPISNFEVAMDADNYKEVKDAATTYKYELVGEKNTYILAWSTTPWNKIVTPALAVNPELTYVKVKQGDEQYILAKSTIKTLVRHPGEATTSIGSPTDSIASPQNDKAVEGKDYEIIEEIRGQDLIGKKFVPHYDYYPIEPGEKAWEIIGGDFVTAEEGTGVVTIAAYGEEDMKAMQKENIHVEMHLDEEGVIKPDVPKFGGMYYLKANKYVNEDLASRGLVYKDEELPHNVPLCWRCHTRLYYAPINAWYVNIQDMKDLMKQTNEKVNWFPKHFKHGRFLKSLENAPDWNISRNRYWGSPVPVWECQGCDKTFVPGSIRELEDAAGQKITDLHKPEIDEVVVPCLDCGGKMKRVPEVLDSWIEAGSASFAERHYPFDSSEKLEDFFPPDFIAEYTGQIRAWFYVLHVIGAALYQSQAFKNVGVEGVILGSDGRKMSKNLGNYPDPKEMLQRFGGDALRLYLMSGAIMHGEDMVISEENYRNQVRGMMLILWNVYNFFVTYANIDKWEPQFVISNEVRDPDNKSDNVLDTWILSLLHTLITDVTKALDGYDTVAAITASQKFVDEFSTWYIRRSRDRVGPTADDGVDKNAFYETTYTVLTTLAQLLAPITPFLSEEIYRNLTAEESVHLTDWPTANQESRIKNQELISQMDHIRKIVETGHADRKMRQLKVRQPLQSVIIDTNAGQFDASLEQLIKDELNVKEVVWRDIERVKTADGIKGFTYSVGFDQTMTPELRAEGEARDIVRKIQEQRKELGTTMDEKVNVTLPEFPESFVEYIKKNALVSELTKGETFAVTRA